MWTNGPQHLALRIFKMNFHYLTLLSNQNNAIISPKIDNTASPHPIKNTTALYKSLLLLAFLFIYYPFTVYLLFRCYFVVISLLFRCYFSIQSHKSHQTLPKILKNSSFALSIAALLSSSLHSSYNGFSSSIPSNSTSILVKIFCHSLPASSSNI